MPNFFTKMIRAGAQEMKGYGILGEHSLQNTISFLTGLSSKELRSKCWKGPTNTFDSCPFIWKEFKKKGYRTMRASDCPDLDVLDGSNGGFLRQPTDYDFRPMAVLSDQIGTPSIHSTNSQCNVCAGEYGRLEMMVTYVEKFARRFQHEKYWGMVWCHSLSQRGSLDVDLYYTQLLTTTEKEGFFENTVIIVVSDIGPQEQGSNKTYEGQLEMRLPLLSILLPRSFKERYPKETKALALNTQRIVSPINLHNTMLHITQLLPPSGDDHSQQHKKVTWKNKDDLKRNPKKDQVRKAKLPKSSTKKGINRRIARYLVTTYSNHRKLSLFRPIRENQFCFDTGIDKQWCPCHSPLVVDEVNYQHVIVEISDYLVSFINKALEPFNKFCEQMSKGGTIGLWRLVPPRALRIFPSRMTNRLAYSYVLKMNISSSTRTSVFMASMVHEWTKEGNRWFTNVESIQIIGKHHNDTNNKCIGDVALQKLCHCRKKNSESN